MPIRKDQFDKLRRDEQFQWDRARAAHLTGDYRLRLGFDEPGGRVCLAWEAAGRTWTFDDAEAASRRIIEHYGVPTGTAHPRDE